MRLFVFLFFLALTAESAPAPQEFHPVQLKCCTFWSSFNGRCYRFIPTAMTWVDAELHCVSLGGNLASVHSDEEHEYVNGLIYYTTHARPWTWIGLTDQHKDGAWMWSDGSAAQYLNWHAGEPNNHKGPENCVHTNFGTKWNDLRCDKHLPFVCATPRAY